MFNNIKNKNSQRGLTLIETVIGISVFVIVVLAIYGLFIAGLKYIGVFRARITATQLANQRMEEIRNMSYDQIGTTQGWPRGSIPSSQVINKSDIDFTVTARVNYVDNPFDGIAPDDQYPWDYKKVSLNIDWQKYPVGAPVVLTTTIAPKGLEGEYEGGTLRITVLDADGDPVPQASVHITNTLITPNIDITDNTDVDGILIVYALPESVEGYHIVVTKSGYSTDSTYTVNTDPQSPDYNPMPYPPDASVFVGRVIDIGFAIDLVSTINISTVSQSYPQNWKVNTDEGIADQTSPSVGIDSSNNSYFIWRDYRDHKWNQYAQKYDVNLVKQWSEDKSIVTAANQGYPDNAVDESGNIYFSWDDDRNGNKDIYLLKYDSNGNQIWTGAKKVNVDAESADQTSSSIGVKGNDKIFLAWQDDRNGNSDIYAQKISPEGNTLWPNDIKVNSNTDSSVQILPKVAVDSTGNMYVAWQDNRNGNDDVYIQKCDTNGNKVWANDVKINSDSGDASQTNSDIAIDAGNNLYIVWQDDRNGNNDIYGQKINSADGSKLWAQDIKINTDTTSQIQSYPTVDSDDSGNIYVAWQDFRYGNYDIYSQRYDTNGAKVWTNDIRINTDSGTTNQEHPDIDVNGAGNLIIYCWQDARNGNYDIYAAKFTGPGEIISVPNVPLHIQGGKKIGDYPNPSPPPDTLPIYKYSGDLSTDLNGNLQLPNMEWDSYTIVPVEGSGYNLVSSDPPQPINLQPNTTQPVILNIE